MRIVVSFSLALAFCTPCLAQTIYKCTATNGTTTFSQAPCAKENVCQGANGQWTKEACVAKRNRPLVEDAAAPVPATEKARNSAIDDIHASVEDSNCRRDAQRRYIVPSTARIASAQSEINDLQSRIWTTNSSSLMGKYAVNSLAQQDAQRIDTLRNLISTEEARNDLTRRDSEKAVNDALAECDRKKAAYESK